MKNGYIYSKMTYMEYTVSEFARLNKVTARTIHRWISLGKLEYRKTKTNRIRIITECENIPKQIQVAVYARVSSRENNNNLESQKNRLISYCNAKGYTVSKVVTEIGSGLNDNRPKLEKLLLDKSINIIVVEHSDRLARFGFNYINKLLEMDGRKILILNPAENDKDDLMQDFVSIVTSYCSRLYGLRRTKRQTEKIIKELEEAKNII